MKIEDKLLELDIIEDEEEKEYDDDSIDSDLLCICGNMRFIVRFRDGDIMALCPECGETVILE